MLKKIATLDLKNISLSHVIQPHFDPSEFRNVQLLMLPRSHTKAK